MTYSLEFMQLFLQYLFGLLFRNIVSNNYRTINNVTVMPIITTGTVAEDFGLSPVNMTKKKYLSELWVKELILVIYHQKI